VFKWAWKRRLVGEYTLAGAALPKARPRPQPCFTTAQVEVLLSKTGGELHGAIAILAYSGMRIGELEQLRWSDVLLDRGELGVFHIRRGGSTGSTKDKEERFVPIHPRLRPLIDSLSRDAENVLPGLSGRQLLEQLKGACRRCGFGQQFKVHSLRHHFASMCANHHTAYKKALSWLGHSSSDILDLYYHLHDEESEAAMKALANV
jgi:integrase